MLIRQNGLVSVELHPSHIFKRYLNEVSVACLAGPLGDVLGSRTSNRSSLTAVVERSIQRKSWL
jgi:hypothetical protein